jgi:hypothetical protein
MKRRVEWTADEAAPAWAEVLRLQGLPPDGRLPPRIAAIVDAGMAEYRRLAEPRAIVAEISREAFAGVYRDAGRNAPATPLDTVFPKAERLALFVATAGERVTTRIRELFERRELALGSMLDSVASAGADRLSELLASDYVALAAAGNGSRALAYSPGYCGWNVTGQRALFAFLAPEEIGVTLNASCLMRPLKSVSGVLVLGPGKIHRFAPDYPFCAQCEEQPCRARIASVLGNREPVEDA